jgi:hypothetical protein
MNRLVGTGALWLLLGCPSPRPIGGPEATPPPKAADPGDTAAPADGRSVGSACVANEDCASGICEGEGCTPDAPGLCVDPQRMCTRDLQAYCDCDGESFHASGSCPVRRFAHRGTCPGDPPLIDEAPPPGNKAPPPGNKAPPPGNKDGGESCLIARECKSGVCEGEGCDEASPGTCAPLPTPPAKGRPCTRDYSPFCGCDGTTFRGSSSCPGQRFAHRGQC